MKKFMTLLLAALTCLCFAACAPANLEKAQEKLKDAGYTIVTYSDETIEGVDGSVGSITAAKSDSVVGGLMGDGEMIMAVLFESASAAKSFYNENKDELEDEGEEDSVVKLDGKWIYVGTEQAVKDFTK